MTEKLYITWDEFHKDTKELCSKIKAKGQYNKIIAVSRGGLLPAGIVAYDLNIRDTEVVNMSTYDGEKQRQQNCFEIKSAEVGIVDERTLVIDDLSDTGNTFNLLRQMFPKACFVSVYAKSKGKSYVDVFTREMPDSWIVFPWD